MYRQLNAAKTWAREHKAATGAAAVGIGGIAGYASYIALGVAFWFGALTLEQALAEVQDDYPSALLQFDAGTNLASNITNLELSTNDQINAASFEEVVQFVEQPEIATVFGIDQARATFQQAASYPDPQLPGYNVLRFEQFIDGVRLLGGDFVVTVKTGEDAGISSIATRAVTLPALDLTPTITADVAGEAARRVYSEFVRSRGRGLSPDAQVGGAELLILDPERLGIPGEPSLVWRVRAASVEMLLSARTGAAILTYDDRHSVLERRTHDCANSAQCPPVLGEQGPIGSGAVDADARFLHEAALTAHQYFLNTFRRNGIDDRSGTGGSAPIVSWARVPNLAGAWWRPDERRIEYPAGWLSLDIAAHEYMHAVTYYGPRLLYQSESGAVSEFVSDFFGVMIQATATGSTDWLVGEGLPGYSAQRPLRNMASPHAGGFDRDRDWDSVTNSGQPEHFGEFVGVTHEICRNLDERDHGCVHFNSGILSKAATLATDGGTFRGVSVAGISRRKMEQIVFRALMTQMTTVSGMKQAATAAIVACNELITRLPAYGITAGDCTQVTRAFTAVGLR